MTATSEPTTCTTCGHVGEVDIPSSTAARVGDLLRRSPRHEARGHVKPDNAYASEEFGYCTVLRLRYSDFTHSDYSDKDHGRAFGPSRAPRAGVRRRLF